MAGKLTIPLSLQTLAYDAIDADLDSIENILPHRIFVDFLKHKFKSDADFVREIEFSRIFDEDLINFNDCRKWRAFTALGSMIFRNYFLYLLEPYICEIKKYQLVVVYIGYKNRFSRSLEMCRTCYTNVTPSLRTLYRYDHYNRIMDINDINETICKDDTYWCRWCLTNPLFYLSN